MVDQGVGDNGDLSQSTKRRKVIQAPDSSSNFFSLLSDDILMEIFIRFPDARSTIQCSSVCKHWYDLLQNPSLIEKFIHHHHHRQSANYMQPVPPYTLLFGRTDIYGKHLCYYDSKLSQLVSEKTASSSRYINFFSDRWLIMAICNDLSLVALTRESYICNLITRKWRRLPNIPHDFGDFTMPPGLVSRSDTLDYKVVVLSLTLDKAAIFSSKTREWILSPVLFPGKVSPHYGSYSVSCNGIVYWLNGQYKFHGIAAFDPFKDVDDEGRCHWIALPPFNGRYWPANTDKTCFGACRDKLRFSIYQKRKTGCFPVKIWELEYDHSGASTSWNLVHHFVLKRDDTKRMYMLAFHPNDGDVIFVLCDRNVYRYEIGEKQFQLLGQWPYNLYPYPRRRWGPKVAAYPLVHRLWPSPIPPTS